MTAGIARALGLLLSSRVRGSTRATVTAADLAPSLRSLPFKSQAGTLYLDLRLRSTHGLLAGNDEEAAERGVMERLVRRGEVAFDIGAHFGLHTILLSRLTGTLGRVFAFEPNPLMLPNLRRTLAPLRNVHLHEVALGDRADRRSLFVPPDESSAGTVSWKPGVQRRFDCTLSVGDDLIRSGVIAAANFIKVDVEGAEPAVFRGLRSLLVSQPVVMFEVCPRAAGAHGNRGDGALSLLASYGKDYLFYVVEPGPRLARVGPSFASSVRGHCNVVAIPHVRCHEVANLIR